MPGPGGQKPDSIAGLMREPVHDFCCFGDACTAQHIHNYRNGSLSRDLQAFFNTPVESVLTLLRSVERCPHYQRFFEFGIEAFHGNTE